ncbi:MAG: GIY-YIG nuclease family protein [Candidatus Falkowbacteria bacterium]
MLKCSDNSLYTGITVDLARRVQEHNETKLGAKYTRVRRPVELVYACEFKNRSEATMAEYQIKQMSRTDKLKIISKQKI